MERFSSSLLSSLPGSPLRRIARFTADPVECQQRVLRTLLWRARDTEWGRRYGFEDVLGAPDVCAAYRARVPVHGFEQFRPEVERLRNGEENILWPGPVRYFAVTSGTASAGRIVPVSADMLACNSRFSVSLGLAYIARTGNAHILAGKHLTLPSWLDDDRRPGVRVGQISAILAETAPWFCRRLHQAVPPELARITLWQDKMTAIARHVIDMDIRLIVFAPSWGRALFGAVIEAYNARHRAGVCTIGEIWPRLQAVVTGAVALSSYQEMLERQIGRPGVDFVEAYGASEGFIAFQTDLADPALLIHLDNGIYYEFIRQDELSSPAPRRYGIGEVEVGVRYAIVMTTNSGLWAYPVGDVVKFTQLDPPKLLVAGRTSEMLDKYGEAVFVDDANQALQQACAASGATAPYFHITHIPMANALAMPAHQWLIEFESPPADMNVFVDTIDRLLKEAGHHYFDRRACLAFDRPQIVSLPPGTFHRWLEMTGKRVSMQSKIPRMLEERSVADRLLETAAERR